MKQFLTDHPQGGWLAPSSVQTLLCCFGLPVLTGATAADASEAVTAFWRPGGPVALKAVARGLLHKSRDGGVILGIRDEQQLRREVAAMRARFKETLDAVFIQPMAAPGRKLLIGIHSDPTFGPLVVFGLGGVDTDLVADRTCRLIPLTDVDADEMIRSLRSFPLLFGSKQPHRLDINAVRDVLLPSRGLPNCYPRSSN